MSFHGKHEIVGIIYRRGVYVSNTPQQCEIQVIMIVLCSTDFCSVGNNKALLWAGLRVEAVKPLNAGHQLAEVIRICPAMKLGFESMIVDLSPLSYQL